MDPLTFVSTMWNATGSFAWPVALLVGLIIFRGPLTKVLLSIKRIRYKDVEAELVAPEETDDQEINGIILILQQSPHSFQWFRDNTEFKYSDSDFDALIRKHEGILEKVNIISRDEEKAKAGFRLPGMRLTKQYRQRVEKALQSF